VNQSPLTALTSFRIYKRDVVIARVMIHTYHVRFARLSGIGPFGNGKF